MPLTTLIILGVIVGMFAAFMLTLAGTALIVGLSERREQSHKAKTPAHAA